MSLTRKPQRHKPPGGAKKAPRRPPTQKKTVPPEEDFKQIDPIKASLIPEGEQAGDQAQASGPRRADRRELLTVLFRLIAEGRLSALSDVYDVLGKGLFGYVRALVGTAQDAEDVLQEVFVKLAEHRRKLVRVDNPHAYVFAVARNEALKLIKHRARVRVTDPEHVMFRAPAPAAKAPVLSPREAQDALATIPALQREVVMLKIYEGFTFAEIGRLTGVSPNTAASRYRYGLGKLAGRLKKYRGAFIDGGS